MTKKVDVKKKVGRHTLFNETMQREIENDAIVGLTDKQICLRLGTNEQTLSNYKRDYPEFFESLKDCKSVADEKVVVSLYKRALGYSHPDVNITNFQGEAIITPIIKHYPPDPTSMIFWLKNRQPAQWRDRKEIDINNKTEVSFDVSQLKPDELVQLSNMLKRIQKKDNNEIEEAKEVKEIKENE